jgi:hypothetical protein
MSKSPKDIVDFENRNSNFHFLSYEVRHLNSLLENINGSGIELLNYIPIRLIAIIENCVRSAVNELVDSGEPYLERGIDLIAKRSNKNLSQYLLYYSAKKLTIGQIASHSFSVSKIADIFSILETTLNTNKIGDEIATQTTRWIEERENKSHPIIKNGNDTFRIIENLFADRHKIAHEITIPPHIYESAPEYIEHTAKFVEAIEWLTIKHLHDYVPRTQSMMNIEAGSRAANALGKLNELRGGSSELFRDCATPSHEIEYHWDKFVELTAKRHAGYFNNSRPGTIAPLLRATIIEELTKWRIDNYNNQLEWSPVRRKK